MEIHAVVVQAYGFAVTETTVFKAIHKIAIFTKVVLC